ncbi:MAG: DegT/DnrJ/EryC1/StrS family aminotransferase, partial [Rhodospirillaceae bacterium]
MQAPKSPDRVVPYVNFQAQFQEERGDILAITERVFASGQFIAGPEVAELEAKWAAYCNVKHAVALNSGTDALIFALLAAGVGRGDEVITTPNSFVASTATVCHLGAK